MWTFLLVRSTISTSNAEIQFYCNLLHSAIVKREHGKKSVRLTFWLIVSHRWIRFSAGTVGRQWPGSRHPANIADASWQTTSSNGDRSDWSASGPTIRRVRPTWVPSFINSIGRRSDVLIIPLSVGRPDAEWWCDSSVTPLDNARDWGCCCCC